MVVARFLDGNVVKGTTHDFAPERSSFHIYAPGASDPIPVLADDLKALFFVKSLMGDSDRHDVRSFLQHGGPEYSKKVAVRFSDGEVVCGYTQHYADDRQGFFLQPASANSNNKNVYVFSQAAAEVRIGNEAEVMVRALIENEAA